MRPFFGNTLLLCFTSKALPNNILFVQITYLLKHLTMTPQESIKTAIALCDGQVIFAKRLTKALKSRGHPRTISQQIVSYWTRSPYGMPSEFCLDVEVLTNFKISKHQLRPDVFGPTPFAMVEE